jgi:Na+-transporting NADH:ubiquinone oxidoreductase subunit C
LLLTFAVEITKDKREAQEKFKIMQLVCESAGMEIPFKTPEEALVFSNSCVKYKFNKTDILKLNNKKPSSAVIFKFSGLWGIINAVINVSPGITESGFQADRIQGLRIISHQETPGLGGRIEEPLFLKQFIDYNLKDPLIISMTPKSESSNSINGITGATMTCSFLEKGINSLLGELKKNLNPKKHIVK